MTPANDKAFTIFVTGSGVNDPVISLTMVPLNIPSQVILMQMDHSDGGSNADEEKPATDAYTENVRYLLRQVAIGKSGCPIR